MQLTSGFRLFFLCCVLFGLVNCKKHSHTLKTKVATVSEKQSTTVFAPVPAINQDIPPSRSNKLPPQDSTLESSIVASYPDIETLSGMALTEISDLLGEPDLARHDPPAIYWQYKLINCTLDFYLYPDKKDKHTHRVTFFQTRGNQPLNSCFTNAIARNKNVPSS
ncbi:MAG: hypothetical protein CMF70_12000 [Magnetovibrio sp.]|nr:hypothetical protein [Magnetovibrio sp.]